MKVTKSYIKQLVKEELSKVLSEQSDRDTDKHRAPNEEEVEAFITAQTRTLSSEVLARNALLYGMPSALRELKSKLKSGEDINISHLTGTRYRGNDRRTGTLSNQEFKSMIGKPHLAPLFQKLTQSKIQGLAEEAAEFLRLVS